MDKSGQDPPAGGVPPDGRLSQAAQPRLHPPAAVPLAALLGGPFAGAIILSCNLKAMGRPESARYSLWWGLSATISLIALDGLLDLFPLLVLGVGTIAIYNSANALQGRALQRHRESGGPFHRLWTATGVGLACAAVTAGLMRALAAILS